MKKLGLFIVAYFVITMAWAYSWHMIWFHDLYTSWGAFQREEPIMVLGIAAILTQGIVIGYLYHFYYRQGSAILQGIKFNLIIGLMTYTAMGFATAAKFQIEPVGQFLFSHTIYQTIQFVLTGSALGLIFKKPRQRRKTMPEYIFTYHGSKMPETPEEGAEGMAKWQAWADSLGSTLTNPGTPVGITKVLTPDGVSTEPASNPIMGFSIIQAESMEAALALLTSCPHLEYGGTLEVSEMLLMPGDMG